MIQNIETRPSFEKQREIYEELKKKGLPTAEGESCFLLNLKWWILWMESLGIKKKDEDDEQEKPNGSIKETEIIVGPINNSDLLEKNKLKKNLLENFDYTIVSSELWKHLVEWYGGGPPIERNIILVGINKCNPQVEVYPLSLTIIKYDYFLSPRSEEFNYEPPPKRARSNLDLEVETSKNATVKQLLEAIARKFSVPPHKSQLWKETKDQQFQVVKPLHLTLEDALVGCTDRLVFETECLNEWKESSEIQKFVAEFDRKTGSKTPAPTIPNEPNSNSQTSILKPKTHFQKGIVGLENLGNTCFMNSSLQCLNASVPLTEYFLSDRHLKDINTKNPLGMQGKIANYYGYLLKKIWSGTSSCIDPSDFKWILGKFAPQFSGYRQHDSQELLAFLLDGLHEDLNKVLEKPPVETFEANGKDDEEAAQESWRRHLLRNKSIIVDLFQGQLKSTLVCPCENTSVTFDPFMYLSLPIPSFDSRIFQILFFDSVDSPIPHKFQVNVPKKGSRISHLLEAVAEKTNQNKAILKAAQIHFSRITSCFENDVFLSSIPTDELAVYETMLQSHVFRVVYRQKGTLFGFPFLLSLSNSAPLTGSVLYEAVQHRIAKFFPDNSALSNNFSLKSVSTSGTDCRECLNKACKGCNIPNEPIALRYRENGSIAIEFSEPVETSLFSTIPPENKESKSPSKKDCTTLFDCLELFLKKEKLGPEDAWYCPKCKKFQQATKQFQLFTLPEILVIHLKRFQFTKQWREKVDVLVDYPINECDFGPYLLKGQTNSKYNLFALSIHSGGLGGGHYTAYCKHQDDWYYFNDSHFEKVSESRISKNRDSYVLFYRRIKN